MSHGARSGRGLPREVLILKQAERECERSRGVGRVLQRRQTMHERVGPLVVTQ